MHRIGTVNPSHAFILPHHVAPPRSHVHIGPRVAFLADQSPADLNHLILVPGHGVTITESLEGADRRDADWYLLDYQRDKDVPNALVGHMRGGLDELDDDKSSLLLFSGEDCLSHSIFFLRGMCVFCLFSRVCAVCTTLHTTCSCGLVLRVWESRAEHGSSSARGLEVRCVRRRCTRVPLEQTNAKAKGILDSHARLA